MGGSVGECRCRFCQRAHRSDNWTQPPVPQPEFEGGEAGATRFDDEEDRPRAFGPHPRGFGDGDEGTARTHQLCRAIEDLAADHIEHHVDLADVFQPILLQIQEGVGPEAEHRVFLCAVRPLPITRAPTSRASCTAIEPTVPAAP